MKTLLALTTVVATGVLYFVAGLGLWVVAGLFILVLSTRFAGKTQAFARLVEILWLFCAVSYFIFELDGIAYPYSLILVLAALVAVIFFEGPEWGELYFLPGETRAHLRGAVIWALVFALVFGVWVYFRLPPEDNPVPLTWPVDALLVVGLGFALYLAIVEEIIFRSFLFQRARVLSSGPWAVVLQGVFFGFMHYRSGIPNGPDGMLLAGLYGIGLGHLVEKSNSLYLAMFVNFCVTLVIFVELVILGKV